jgi:predicted phage tail component-like protein
MNRKTKKQEHGGIKMKGITFNNTHSSTFPGLIINKIHRPFSAPRSLVMQKVPGRRGAYLQDVEEDVLVQKIDVTFHADTQEEYNKLLDDVRGWLLLKETAELILDKEPDRFMDAILGNSSSDLEEMASFGEGTLTFVAPDGLKHGTERRQTIAVPPATFNRDSTAYDSEGNSVAIDEARYSVVGKNLVPSFYEWDLHANATVISPYELELNATGDYQYSQVHVSVNPNQSYTYSVGAGERISYVLYDSNDNYVTEGATTASSITFTTTADTSYVRIRVDNGATSGTFAFSQPQLELGDTATDFEPIDYGVLVGEGTENLLTSNQATVETDTTGFSALGSTISRDTTKSWQGSASLNVTKNLGTYEGIAISYSEASQGDYVGQTRITGAGSVAVWLRVTYTDGTYDQTTNKVINLSGEWQYVETNVLTTDTAKTVDNVTIYVRTDVQQGITFHIDGNQLEQKPYATTFVDGTRSAETLTIPTDGVLFADEGTVEVEFYVDDVAEFNSRNNYFFDVNPLIDNNNRILIYNIDSSTYRFLIGNGSTYDVANISSSNVVQGLNYIVATWNGSEVTFKLNNIESTDAMDVKQASAVIENTTVYIGSGTTSINHINSQISNLRISRTARSDSEILDTYENGFTVDEHTTAYFAAQDERELRSLVVQAPSTITNKGTAETLPIFKATMLQDTTFLSIISPDKYISIGAPFTVEETPTSPRTRVFNEKMESTTGWASGTSVDKGVVDGSIVSDGQNFVPDDFGAGSGWHGPALKKSLSSTAQDFMVEVVLDNDNSPNASLGRVEIYLLDDLNNVIGVMAVKDAWTKEKINLVQFRAGDLTNGHYIIDGYGSRKANYNDFYGYLRVERVGDLWTVYVARIGEGGVHFTEWKRRFRDIDGLYTAQLAQIQVHFGQYADYPTTIQRVRDINAYKLNSLTETEIPYIAEAGDEIEFDHENAAIRKNGEVFMWAKDFASDFFSIGKGDTELTVRPSDVATVEAALKGRWS